MNFWVDLATKKKMPTFKTRQQQPDHDIFTCDVQQANWQVLIQVYWRERAYTTTACIENDSISTTYPFSLVKQFQNMSGHSACQQTLFTVLGSISQPAPANSLNDEKNSLNDEKKLTKVEESTCTKNNLPCFSADNDTAIHPFSNTMRRTDPDLDRPAVLHYCFLYNESYSSNPRCTVVTVKAAEEERCENEPNFGN